MLSDFTLISAVGAIFAAMKRTLILSLALLAAACGQSAQEHFAQAKQDFAANRYSSARLHLVSGLAAEPGNREMQLLQVRTLIAMGDGEGAGAGLDKLAREGPRSTELRQLSAEAALLRNAADEVPALLGTDASAEAERLRAIAAIQQGKPDLARAAFERAMLRAPDPRVLTDYGRFLLVSGEGEKARKLLAQAVSAAPDSFDTLMLRGQIASIDGDLAGALDTFARASKHYPENRAALIAHASVLGDLGRADEMKPLLERLTAFAPDDPAVVYLKARSAALAKDWEAVRAAVQPQEAKLPLTHPARIPYGEALLRLGNPQLAAAQLEPILRAQPNNRTVARLLAEAKLAGGDPAGARSVLTRFASDPAAPIEDVSLMARIAVAQKSPDAAQWQQRARFPAAQSLAAELGSADAAMRARYWARAIVIYDHVLEVTDGKNVMVLNNQAYCLAMAGNLERARELADKALKLAPASPSVLDTAGWVRVRSGKDIAEARSLLRKASAAAPQNQTIRAHLAEAERAPG